MLPSIIKDQYDLIENLGIDKRNIIITENVFDEPILKIFFDNGYCGIIVKKDSPDYFGDVNNGYNLGIGNNKGNLLIGVNTPTYTFKHSFIEDVNAKTVMSVLLEIKNLPKRIK